MYKEERFLTLKSKNRGNASKFNNQLVVIGDDFAAGEGDGFDFARATGIVKYMGMKLASMSKIRQNWNLYNYGVRGTTTRDWLPVSEKVPELYNSGIQFSHHHFNYQQSCGSIILIWLWPNLGEQSRDDVV